MPPLKFHNTLSGTLEEFKPLGGKQVLMYNCGPTPYDRQHIGNMVPPILADTIRRTLEAWGYEVKQVMNVTDFGHLTGDNEGDPNIGDDKMMKGLKQEGLSPTMENMRVLAEKYANVFFDDIRALGVDTNRVTYPFASKYIAEQIDLIKRLESKGYAYLIKDGVYYDTGKFEGYGKLGNINLEGQKEGARVTENTEKRNPRDFVLWKLSDKMGWESPWGKGFPGWHIECTAMIFKLLGEQIDIHTGGIEHIPIHHNNEIAQAEAATGKQFVKYWLHNNHITIDGKKISKSLGNTVYVSDLTARGLSPKAFRYWYLTGHYRTPTNFTWEAIEGANTALGRLTRTYLELPDGGASNKEFLHDFYAAIAKDLDTAGALALTWDFIKNDSVPGADKKATLAEIDTLFGLGFTDKEATIAFRPVPYMDLPAGVQKFISEREEARKTKDFAKSDELRKKIEEAGYDIKDTPEGPSVYKK
jgi:cysteinyl-tRNA synthetase